MTAFRMPSESGFDVGHNSGSGIAVADPNELDSLLGNDTPSLSIHQPSDDNELAAREAVDWVGPVETGEEPGDPEATPPDNGDDASDAPELDEGELDEVGQVEDATTLADADVTTDELPPGSVTEAEASIAIAETVAADSAPTTPIIDDWFRDQFAKIHNAEIACMRAESTLEDLKQQAKEAKEHLEGCVLKLRALCREAQREQAKEQEGGYSLFSGSAAATADEPGPEPASEPLDGSTIECDTAWRSVTLDYLDIPARVVQSLLESGINTLGDLADFTAGGRKLTEIKGIGKAAAEKITEAAEDYHRERLASQGVKEVEPVEEGIGEGADGQPISDPDSLDSDHTTDVDLLDGNGVPVDWREVSCEHLSITEAVLGKVYRQGLETLGDLADWLADQKNDVAAIGGKKAGEKIVAAFEALKAKYEGVAAGQGDQANQAEEPTAAEAPQSIGDDVLE